MDRKWERVGPCTEAGGSPAPLLRFLALERGLCRPKPHTCMRTRAHAYMRTRSLAYAHAVHTRTHMHVHTLVHTLVHTHMHVYTRERAHTHACAHARLHTHTHARTHARTHIRTRKNARTHAHTHKRARTRASKHARTHTKASLPRGVSRQPHTAAVGAARLGLGWAGTAASTHCARTKCRTVQRGLLARAASGLDGASRSGNGPKLSGNASDAPSSVYRACCIRSSSRLFGSKASTLRSDRIGPNPHARRDALRPPRRHSVRPPGSARAELSVSTRVGSGAQER